MNIPVFAIIGARNEARDIENVLRQLGRAGIQGAVVVCNGGTDDTLARTLAFNAQSPFPVATVFFHAALGHDVARAVGTYALLRRVSAACKSAYCLYLDADLSGSFGPMLADFIAFGTAEDRDVTSLSSSCLRDEGMAGAAAIWREALHHQKAVPESAVPFMVPLLVHTRLFRRVSPLLLANPGCWVAVVARLETASWCTYDAWDNRLVGHRSRSPAHARAMRERIALDGRTVYSILGHRQLPRTSVAPCAPLPSRNLEALERYAAAATWIIPPRGD
ncbi:hypothetical protein NZD89_01380 [Alicyclobacillus fastidiosus]|uniref:Glycosyltransferase 2-like domain-containing protein n=1 Tax=Alicyclobacillus fastidiosus TaxID=392011 RepID=A0ABY6ZJA7_9BACL|nr:hypothetical protein [Alicyclobacillus fastidiosus]WAH42194.1 hypothetical protein NZD89_01380 [Alicyclobacillus fastidiosus]